MEEMDKTIEVIKAAMEKESNMMDREQESMEEQIDTADPDLTDEAASDMEEEIEENEAANEESIEEKPVKQGKSFFKNNKNKDLVAKDLKIEELTERLMRTMAEFDNYRKRTEKEKAQMYDIGVKSIIEKLLPIIDNFERGLGTITDKDKDSAFAQGIEMIYKQLMNTLEEIGVKPIEAVGKEFDPAFHNAVMHGEDETLGENIISDEFQKGYMYRELVIRHSMVKVVN